MTRITHDTPVREKVIVVDFSKYYKPHPKQILAHKAPERFVLFGGSMGAGKSVWLCAEAIQHSLDYPGNRGFLARHEFSAFKRTTFLTLMSIIPPEVITKHNQQDKFIEFINHSRIYYGGLKGTEKGSSIDRLKSMDLGWFGIDEASETLKDMFLLLVSRLRLKVKGYKVRYKGLLTSNPEPGWVRELFVEGNLPNSVFIPALPEDNPDLPPDLIPSLMATFPPEWIQKYLKGDWDVDLDSDVNYIFPYAWVSASIGREDPDYPLEPIELGVDVGRGGDESVIVVRRGYKVEIPFAARLADTMKLVGKVLECVDQYEPTAIKVDSVGVGGGVADRLREHPLTKDITFEFIGGATPDDPERFARKRSEAHWMLRKRLEEGRISLPDDPQLKSELVSVRYDIRSDRRIYAETKEEMKRRGMKSPNRADAVMMAFSTGKPLAGPGIFVL